MIRIVVPAVVLVFVALAWPAVLGGATSYVVVSGVSMEPVLSTGDLVVVRRASSYEVGDTIAFRTEEGDVIHRIVGGDAIAGFVTQGDNVDRVDPYRPTPDDIRGRQVFSIPVVGGLGLRLVSVVPAPLIGAGALLLAAGGDRSRRRRRTRRRREPAAREPLTAIEVDVDTRMTSRIRAAAICALAALVVLPSAFVAWRTPTQVAADAATAEVTHTLQTTVTGLADQPSTLYPDARSATIEAAPGDPAGAVAADAQPLLRQLLDTVEVDVSYAAEGVTGVGGTGTVAVELVTGRGFVLPSEPATTVDFVDVWDETVRVDLAATDAALAEYLATSGLGRDTITARITPTVITSDGTVIRGEPTVLEPTDEIIGVSGSLRTVVTPQTDDGTVAAMGRLLGVPMSVAAVRIVAPLLLVALLGVAAVLLRREEQDRPDLRVGLLYGSLLVEIEEDANVGGDLVRVSSIAELARLARRDHRSILHQRRPDGSHRYFVPDADLTYEFTLGAPSRPLSEVVPDDIAPLDDLDLPASPDDVLSRPVIVEDFAELSRVWLRGTSAPGRLERRRLADGRVRYAVVRDGREFVYEADADEDVVRSGGNRG